MTTSRMSAYILIILAFALVVDSRNVNKRETAESLQNNIVQIDDVAYEDTGNGRRFPIFPIINPLQGLLGPSTPSSTPSSTTEIQELPCESCDVCNE